MGNAAGLITDAEGLGIHPLCLLLAGMFIGALLSLATFGSSQSRQRLDSSNDQDLPQEQDE